MLLRCHANKIQMCSNHGGKRKVMLICENRLMQQTDSFSEPWMLRLSPNFICLNSEEEKAHYQSTTGTISSSGWFPTTWSMKSSFPTGLLERKDNGDRYLLSLWLQLQLYNSLSKLTVFLIRGPWIEGHKIQAETIHCILFSPQVCVWCPRTAEDTTSSTTVLQSQALICCWWDDFD